MTSQHGQIQTVGEYADCISYSWKCQVLDEVLKKKIKWMELSLDGWLFLLSEDIQTYLCCPEITWAWDQHFIPVGLSTTLGGQISTGSPSTLLGLDVSTFERSAFFQINFQIFLVEQQQGLHTALYKSLSRKLKLQHRISNTSVTTSFIKSLGERERYLFYISCLMPF